MSWGFGPFFMTTVALPLGSAPRVPKTEAMTQRVELAAVLDRSAIDALITDYAITVDDGDWDGYRQLFVPDGRADYRSAGGIEGPVPEIADWLAKSLGVFAMCQHLIVNRRIEFGLREQDIGDTARIQADYVNPMRFAAAPGTAAANGPAGETAGAEGAEGTPGPAGAAEAERARGTAASGHAGTPAPDGAPDIECGGRYAFTAVRTHGGWRLRQAVVQEKWRRQRGGRD